MYQKSDNVRNIIKSSINLALQEFPSEVLEHVRWIVSKRFVCQNFTVKFLRQTLKQYVSKINSSEQSQNKAYCKYRAHYAAKCRKFLPHRQKKALHKRSINQSRRNFFYIFCTLTATFPTSDGAFPTKSTHRRWGNRRHSTRRAWSCRRQPVPRRYSWNRCSSNCCCSGYAAVLSHVRSTGAGQPRPGDDLPTRSVTSLEPLTSSRCCSGYRYWTRVAAIVVVCGCCCWLCHPCWWWNGNLSGWLWPLDRDRYRRWPIGGSTRWTACSGHALRVVIDAASQGQHPTGTPSVDMWTGLFVVVAAAVWH